MSKDQFPKRKTSIFGPAVIMICCLCLAWIQTLQAAPSEKGLTLLEAVSTGIVQAPEISLAREDIASSRARVQIEQGEQDPSLSIDTSYENLQYPLTPHKRQIYHKSAEDTQTLHSKVTARKTLDNGISLSQSVGLERTDDDLLDSPPDNYATVNFAVFLPLARLWANGFTADIKKNSEIWLESSYQDLASSVSDSARSTALAFWEVLAQKKILTLHREAEAEAGEFLQDMKILVAKDEYPAANLEKIKADVDAKAVQTIAQEQAVYAARQALALNMGVEVDQLQDLPEISGQFPAVQTTGLDIQNMIAAARSRRPDIQAKRTRLAYYQELVDDAREEAMPEIGLNLQAGYHGLRETGAGRGYIDSLGRNVPGPSYSVGLSYTKHFGNNVAEGKLNQARVDFRKQRIAARNLERRISSEILTAYQEYLHSARALQQQQDAIRTYQSALDKERTKFKHQLADVSDLLEARDNYRQSLTALVTQQKAYAASIVRLRHACGDLVKQRDARFQVKAENLTTPPG